MRFPLILLSLVFSAGCLPSYAPDAGPQEGNAEAPVIWDEWIFTHTYSSHSAAARVPLGTTVEFFTDASCGTPFATRTLTDAGDTEDGGTGVVSATFCECYRPSGFNSPQHCLLRIDPSADGGTPVPDGGSTVTLTAILHDDRYQLPSLCSEPVDLHCG